MQAPFSVNFGGEGKGCAKSMNLSCAGALRHWLSYELHLGDSELKRLASGSQLRQNRGHDVFYCSRSVPLNSQYYGLAQGCGTLVGTAMIGRWRNLHRLFLSYRGTNRVFSEDRCLSKRSVSLEKTVRFSSLGEWEESSC